MVAGAPDDRLGREHEGQEEEAGGGPQQISLQPVAGHCGTYGLAAGPIGDRRDGPGGQASDRRGGEAHDEEGPATSARRAVRAAPPQRRSHSSLHVDPRRPDLVVKPRNRPAAAHRLRAVLPQN
jgi:hypothetical protein